MRLQNLHRKHNYHRHTLQMFSKLFSRHFQCVACIPHPLLELFILLKKIICLRLEITPSQNLQQNCSGIVRFWFWTGCWHVSHVAFSTIMLESSFSWSLSLHSHIGLYPLIQAHLLPLNAARRDSISNLTSFGASYLSSRQIQCRFI